jgi:hypothetical protein
MYRMSLFILPVSNMLHNVQQILAAGWRRMMLGSVAICHGNTLRQSHMNSNKQTKYTKTKLSSIQ